MSRSLDQAPLPCETAGLGARASLFPDMDEWYPVQVKQKDKAGRPDIDVCPGPFAEEN